jgi:hypothetical protein
VPILRQQGIDVFLRVFDTRLVAHRKQHELTATWARPNQTGTIPPSRHQSPVELVITHMFQSKVDSRDDEATIRPRASVKMWSVNNVGHRLLFESSFTVLPKSGFNALWGNRLFG